MPEMAEACIVTGRASDLLEALGLSDVDRVGQLIAGLEWCQAMYATGRQEEPPAEILPPDHWQSRPHAAGE